MVNERFERFAAHEAERILRCHDADLEAASLQQQDERRRVHRGDCSGEAQDEPTRALTEGLRDWLGIVARDQSPELDEQSQQFVDDGHAGRVEGMAGLGFDVRQDLAANTLRASAPS
jgi:hypothetical protein